MAFPHGTARCWTSRIRKSGESAAERVCRLGQSPSKGLFFTGLQTWPPSEPSVLFFMLISEEVTHFITLQNCCVVKTFAFSWRQIIIGVTKCTLLRLNAYFAVYVYPPRVEEAYRRISGPACVTVDASPSADQVLRQVQLLIRGKCHL